MTQDDIARSMSIRVVHSLEMIDVSERDRDRTAVPTRPTDLRSEAPKGRLAIEDTGELIGRGDPFHGTHLRRQLDDRIVESALAARRRRQVGRFHG